MDLYNEAREIDQELIELRREIHRHPEVGFHEHRTTETIARELERAGVRFARFEIGTGLIGRIGPEAEKRVALRADIDALPIQEETGLPFASEVPGVAHLCGHDVHTAMLIGAARLLTRHEAQLRSGVKLIFQPAEELAPGGAKKVVAEGHLDDVSEIYALHVSPDFETGKLGLREGPMMAAMDRFSVTLIGRGGHGAMPHTAADPVVPSAELILALQTIVSRRIKPLDAAVVSVCTMEAGTAFNVIPGEAKITGTCRSLVASVQEEIEQRLEKISNGVAQAHGLEAEVEYHHGTPPLANNSACARRLRSVFSEIFGPEAPIVEITPTMGGEDFAFYLQKVPGAFAFIGAGDKSEHTVHSFHNSRFQVDEGVIARGAALLAGIALNRASGAKE